ncbi:MAG: thiol oxidoreductase [Myxococcales bacterium]|nr:thiol oxidoreductase [Myxococcales bacterium]
MRIVSGSALALLSTLSGCDLGVGVMPTEDTLTTPSTAPTTPSTTTTPGSTTRSLPVIGQEVSMSDRMEDGDEHKMPLCELVGYGGKLFAADWTEQEGGGRPLTKGTGAPLTDPSSPLVFPHNFNRISAPDANACSGCHAKPFVGGGGDVVANVFVLGQRFDFATFDPLDDMPTRGAVDENGFPVMAQDIANERATLGMFGSGFIEMLARQMTADLQDLRDALVPGDSVGLTTKGVSFGMLSRDKAGAWQVELVEGLPAPSIATTGPTDPPSLVLRPFHQAGAVVSIREFTNNAYNHHHGIQTTERFGVGTDPDGDGYVDEMSVAEVTAATVWQATLDVPGRVMPTNPYVLKAVEEGEALFDSIGCAECHVPALPLDEKGWIYTEPNPYNPPGNLSVDEATPLEIDLTDPALPGERLQPENGVVWVPAFTDLKLHDITSGYDDPNAEPLNMHHPGGSTDFEDGNSQFLTKKLWGAANEAPYFHHGKFVTMRQAIEAHAGEATDSKKSWDGLTTYERDTIIEFLKTLKVLDKGDCAY